MQTKVEQLDDARVKLEVEIGEHDVDHAFEHAASDLAESLRIPGFRKGKKVPMPVVVSRIGREALATEAVRSHVEGWFWAAAAESGIRPVAEPSVEWADLPRQGGRFAFTATVEVMPKPKVADWTTLEVPAPEPTVPPELVDEAVDALRRSVAAPARVTRPAQAGDTVVVDLIGDERTDNYVVELGDGRLLDEIEQALLGTAPGETKQVSFEMDDRPTTIEVAVKEVYEPELPEADDTFARDASEFGSLAELRADIEQILRTQLEGEVDAAVREAALDALADASTFEKTDVLVAGRARALWDNLVHSLARRGITPQTYLASTGQDPALVEQRLIAEADRSVRRELALEGVVDKLQIEISDEEVEAYVREQAGLAGEDPGPTLEAMRGSRWERLRKDLAFRKALDEVAQGVKRIPVELARAREQLWTPEKEKPAAAPTIWTPGSKEP